MNRFICAAIIFFANLNWTSAFASDKNSVACSQMSINKVEIWKPGEIYNEDCRKESAPMPVIDSPDVVDKKSVIAQAYRDAAKRIESDDGNEGYVPGSSSDPNLGIQSASDIGDLNRKDYTFYNSWIGFRDGKYYRYTAGYQRPDPSAGLLIIEGDDIVGSPVILRTPTSTGPVYISAEKDGILTLKSKAGKFDAFDMYGDQVHRTVVTPGGATYYFDTRLNEFK